MPENPQDPAALKEKILADFNKSIGLSSPDTSTSSSSEGGYDPKPKAIDTLKQFTGNSFTGPVPAITGSVAPPEPGNFAKNAANYVTSMAAGSTDVDKIMKPFTYNADYDGANFERYYSHGKFAKLGFNPYRDNEALYNDNSTLGDEFSRAAAQWPALVKSGFMSGVRSWDTLFTDPLAPDMKGAKEMEKAMAIGSSSKKGAGSFAINTFLNSGYTIGIGGELLLEELALAGATTLSAGIASEVTLPTMLARGGAAIKKMMGAEKLKDLIKVEKLDDARSIWNTSVGKVASAAGRTLNPLENTFQYGKDLIQGEKYAAMAAKEGKTMANFAKFSDGFGSFARDIMMIKSAVGEAKLEGGSTQMNVTKELIQKYRDSHNGEDPSNDELASIHGIAAEEAKRTALWNLPAIMWSNKFMYETVMKPFEKTAVKPLKDIVFDPKKFADGSYYKKVGLGAVERTKAIAQSLVKPKTYADFGLNYLKANVAEGIQENLQEAIAAGAASHAVAKYTNKDRGAYEAYMGHFMKGLGEQASAQGIETFASGFLMGAMAQPVMAAPTWLGQTVWNNTVNRKAYGEYKEMRDKQLDEQVTHLNEMYNDLGKYFAPEIANAMSQAKIGEDYSQAVLNGDRKGAEDAKDQSMFEHLTTALKTNTMDNFLDRFKELKGLSPEEAAQAFNVLPEQGAAVLKNMDAVIKRAESLKNTWETLDKKFPNQFNPSAFPKGSPEYIDQVIGYKAWEEAKTTYLFAKSSYDRHRERLSDIAKTFTTKSAPVGNMSVQDLHVLLDPVLMDAHFKSLRDQMKNLDHNIPEQSKEKTKLEKELILLHEYRTAIGLEKNKKDEIEGAHTVLSAYNLEMGTNIPLSKATIDQFILAQRSEEAKAIFKDYLKHKTKGTGEFIFDEKVDTAFDLIKDHMALQGEMSHLAKTINILTSPEGFIKTFSAVNREFAEAFAKKEQMVKERLNDKVNVVEINRGLQRLTKEAGVHLDPDYIEGFMKSIEAEENPALPGSFINISNKEKITEGPIFDQASQIWQETIDLLKVKKESIVKEEPALKVEETVTTPEVKSSGKITPDTPYSDYPLELKNQLGPAMAEYVEENTLDIDEPTNALIDELSKEFLQTAKAQAAINNYNGFLEKSAPVETPKASVAFQITTSVKQELSDLGYSKDDIYKMRPEEAQAIIAAQTTKGKVAPITQEKAEPTRGTLPATMEELDGQKVERAGIIGIIRVAGPDKILFETDNVDYDLENADIHSNPSDFGLQGIVVSSPEEEQPAYQPISKYQISNTTEDAVTVNGVDYIINVDTLGNIESLSPVNKPEQKIHNTKLILAVEIDRNRLERPKESPEVINTAVENRIAESSVTEAISDIYNTNFTDTVADGLDKLYDKTSMTEQEKLQVELWAFDALDKILSLQDKNKDNEEINNASKNLRIIINVLHEEQSYTQKQVSSKQAATTKSTKKGSGKISKASSEKQKARVEKKAKVAPQTIAVTTPTKSTIADKKADIETPIEKKVVKETIDQKIVNAQSLKEVDNIARSLPIAVEQIDDLPIDNIEQMIIDRRAELLKVISPENLKYAKENNLRVSYNDPNNSDISGSNFAVKSVGKKFATIVKPSLTLKVPIADIEKFITSITDPMEETPVTEISAEAQVTAKDNLSKEKEILDKKKTEAAMMIKKVKTQPKADTDNNLINKLC